MASVGQELLAVPLPEMVMKLGLGIAEGAGALDQNSVETAKMLAETTVPLVMAVTQTISSSGDVYLPIRIQLKCHFSRSVCCRPFISSQRQQ
jgi:hypothetical protein